MIIDKYTINGSFLFKEESSEMLDLDIYSKLYSYPI